VVLTDDFPIGPLAMAIAKAFPQFSMKSGDDSTKNKHLHVTFVKSDGTIVDDPVQLKAANVAVKGVQLASRLVDSHPELLTTTEFSKQVRALVDEHPKVRMTEIIGKDLFAKGYGGLYAVGKAANCPPRMIILEYDGANGIEDAETVALVGKGIVYDTGGLSLKSRDGMTGMKHDMGGSAGMVGGFFSAVELGVKKNVTCILCLAENAIGPDAFRNDGTFLAHPNTAKSIAPFHCISHVPLALFRHFENVQW
jgi:probable aminopeptidase NPEPL1